MSIFIKLKNIFSVNWTTILVGWEGLGVFSPFKWEDFPPLLTLDEVYEYCYEAIGKTDDTTEIGLIINALEFEKKTVERAFIRLLLQSLADLHHVDKVLELRKWRVILCAETLEKLQNEMTDDLASLKEFWMCFGFPKDSPMEYQGVGNNIRPEDFYTYANHKKVVSAHKTWVQNETQEIKKSDIDKSRHF